MYTTQAHTHTHSYQRILKVNSYGDPISLPAKLKLGRNCFHSAQGLNVFILLWGADTRRPSEQKQNLPELWLNSHSPIRTSIIIGQWKSAAALGLIQSMNLQVTQKKHAIVKTKRKKNRERATLSQSFICCRWKSLLRISKKLPCSYLVNK